MKKFKIILASASPRRQELLRQIGLEFTVCPSQKEEKTGTDEPAQVVCELSKQKAADVFEQMLAEQKMKEAAEGTHTMKEPYLVIGADTIVACDKEILGKPKNEEDACRMLTLLQGRSHQVYTGVTVYWQERRAEAKEDIKAEAKADTKAEAKADTVKKSLQFYECTDVKFYPMSKEEIAAYVATGDPMDKAGAYGIQGCCAAFIAGISGDYNNVVGLPAGRLYQELHKKGLL